MVCKLQTVCVVPSFFCPAIEPMLPTRSKYGCILYSNTLCIIQDFRTEAAARRLRHGLRLLIIAAAHSTHRVRSVRAGYYGSRDSTACERTRVFGSEISSSERAAASVPNLHADFR
eukprot:COSAG01_NODE_306_length_19162_cov_14.196611_6_plen_116_part_00